MKLDNKSKDFLHTYMNNASPTGFEVEGQKLWKDYITPFVDHVESDVYGSVFAVINPNHEYRVVIEAHADEISWFVNYISDDGFIYVIRNGGSDNTIAPSKRVDIHTDQGIVKGVFGWPAIHVRKGEDRDMKATMEKIFIDVGAKDKQEVEEMGIYPGCVITFEDQFMTLNDRYFCGRALDNRIGGFCIAEVARLLKSNHVDLPFGLYIVNAVQEEIGLRGAEMIAHTIKPNMAIITDVTHDTRTPHISKVEHGDVSCGNGPVLTYAPSIHLKLQKFIIDIAKKETIPYQLRASSRYTGTDTDAFAYSNGGIPSALISLPLRYMHTTVEMAQINDVEQLIELIYQTLVHFRPDFDFKYF